MEKKGSVFQEVADKIKKRVVEGVYVSAQRLPSEYDLAKEFDVSRLTVRKAIDSLIQQNVLVKQKGKGTYVMKQSEKIQSGRSGLQGFTEAAKAYGKDSQTKVITFEKLSAIPDEAVEALQLESGEAVYHITRVRSIDKEPMTVEDLYIKAAYVPTITKKQASGSLFTLIEEQIEISYSHQEVEAILMTEKLSELLQVEEGNPVLMVHSITYSADAKPILYDTSYYRADRYTFKNILHRTH